MSVECLFAEHAVGEEWGKGSAIKLRLFIHSVFIEPQVQAVNILSWKPEEFTVSHGRQVDMNQ